MEPTISISQPVICLVKTTDYAAQPTVWIMEPTGWRPKSIGSMAKPTGWAPESVGSIAKLIDSEAVFRKRIALHDNLNVDLEPMGSGVERIFSFAGFRSFNPVRRF